MNWTTVCGREPALLRQAHTGLQGRLLVKGGNGCSLFREEYRCRHKHHERGPWKSRWLSELACSALDRKNRRTFLRGPARRAVTNPRHSLYPESRWFSIFQRADGIAGNRNWPNVDIYSLLSEPPRPSFLSRRGIHRIYPIGCTVAQPAVCSRNSRPDRHRNLTIDRVAPYFHSEERAFCEVRDHRLNHPPGRRAPRCEAARGKSCRGWQGVDMQPMNYHDQNAFTMFWCSFLYMSLKCAVLVSVDRSINH